MNYAQPRLVIYLYLLRDEKVCLIRRAPSLRWMPGKWSVPTGHVENGESIRVAMARETFEEIGVTVDSAALPLVHVRYDPEDAYLGFYFVAEQWQGEPVNAEPDKATALQWFPLTALPEDFIPHQRAALEAWQRGEKLELSSM